MKDHMYLRALALTLTIATSASFALADETSGTAPSAEKKAPAVESTSPDAADPSKRVVCKSEKPTGSMIPARICKTAGEWQSERDNSQKFMQDLQKNKGATHGG